MAKIIVIEDDNAVRFSVQLTLESLGHQVDVAVNGVEGCEKCATTAYDLVISDLIMPQRDGVETIAELRRNYPTLRIIAMTGGSQDLDFHELTDQIGADDVLVKPFTIDELMSCLSQVLGDGPGA